jgi:hypothetical protein
MKESFFLEKRSPLIVFIPVFKSTETHPIIRRSFVTVEKSFVTQHNFSPCYCDLSFLVAQNLSANYT